MAPRLTLRHFSILTRRGRFADSALALLGIAIVAASVWAVPGAGGFLGACLGLLMLAIAVTDARHSIIPDKLNAAALVLALVNAAVADPASIVEGIAGAALRGSATMLFFLAVRWLYGWLRQREGLGLGDVKLACVAGAWLDWAMIPVAIEIATLAALTAYLAWRVLARKPFDAASRLPFGLFFAPAIWLSWLAGIAVFGLG